MTIHASMTFNLTVFERKPYLMIKQQIFRLDVSVNDMLLMTVQQSLCETSYILIQQNYNTRNKKHIISPKCKREKVVKQSFKTHQKLTIRTRSQAVS